MFFHSHEGPGPCEGQHSSSVLVLFTDVNGIMMDWVIYEKCKSFCFFVGVRCDTGRSVLQDQNISINSVF